MSMIALVGETYLVADVERRRERAMQQYNRRQLVRGARRRHWPFTRKASARRIHRPAVS